MSRDRELCDTIRKIWFHALTPEGKQILYGLSPEVVVELENLWYSPLGRRTHLNMFQFFTAMLRDELGGCVLFEHARHYQFDRAWNDYHNLRRESASADSRINNKEGSV